MSHYSCGLKYILSIVVLLFAAQSKAATFTYSGDQLTGVNGVEALGGTWNVTFHAGSFTDVNAIYNLSLPFAYTDTESQDLSVGLISAMSPLDGILAPIKVNGCDDIRNCAIITPYAFATSNRVEGFSVGVRQDLTSGILSISAIPAISRADIDTDFDFNTYAVWDVSPVPVPAAVWLFGSGLIGLIGVTRRKTV